MKEKNVYIGVSIALGAAALGAAAWLLLIRKKTNTGEKLAPERDRFVLDKSRKFANSEFPLGYNPSAKSDLVKQWQAKLNRHQVRHVVEDGYFGEETAHATWNLLEDQCVTTADFMYHN